MSDTINKGYRKLLLLIFMFYTCLSISAQEKETIRHIKFIGGGGCGYFFNPFTESVIYHSEVIRPAFSGKLLWEPEHRLSLGVESGYYFIHSTRFELPDKKNMELTTNLNVVPLFLSFSMKIVNHLEINFATGWASMIYHIKVNDSSEDMTIGHFYSMSNFSTGLSWYYPLNKDLNLGTELKYIYFGKTDDMHLSLFINLSWNIITRRIIKS